MSPSGLPSSRLQAGSSLLAFAGKIVPQHHFYLDFNHKAKKFETILIEAVSFISLEQSGKVRNGKLSITFGKLLCGLDSGYTFNSWHFPMKSIEY